MPLSRDGIQLGFMPGRVNPELTMWQVNEPLGGGPDAVCANDDQVLMGLQAATHWDALAHVSYGGKLYNGYPADSVTASGTAKCSIARAGAVISRGVLLDVARAKGVNRLDGGYAITESDLDQAADLAKITPAAGDIM